jgi:hypothetical protein
MNNEEDIYNFLYSVMKGKIKDVIITKEKDENNKLIIEKVPVSVSVRMKAAELLFKTVAEPKSGEDILPVIICDDIGK